MEKSLYCFYRACKQPFSRIAGSSCNKKTLSSPSTLPDRQIQDIFSSPKCLATVYKCLQLCTYTHKVDRGCDNDTIRIHKFGIHFLHIIVYNTSSFSPTSTARVAWCNL